MTSPQGQPVLPVEPSNLITITLASSSPTPLFPIPSTSQTPKARKGLSQSVLEYILVTLAVVLFAVIALWRVSHLRSKKRPIRQFFAFKPAAPSDIYARYQSRSRRNSRTSSTRGRSRSQSRTRSTTLTYPPRSNGPTSQPHAMLEITPTLLYHSGLAPIPTAYDPASSTRAPGAGGRGRNRRAARAIDLDSGGRRMGSRDIDDEEMDLDGDDKEILPAYERRAKGLPAYGDVLTLALSEGAIPSGISISEERGRMLMVELMALVNPEDMSNHYVPIDTLEPRSNVFIARSVANDSLVEVECIPILNPDSSLLEDFPRTLRQLQVMRRISHDAFLEFKDAFISGTHLWIVSQYIEKIMLDDLLRAHGALGEPVLAKVCFEVCRALQYLHLNQIVHRSIKSSNIAITEHGSIKLMNLSNTSPTPCADAIPQAHTTAPEVLDHYTISVSSSSSALAHPQPPPVDIWALGILCLELFDQHSNSNSLFERPVEEAIEELRTNGPTFDDSTSEEMRTFVEGCLTVDPDMRPSAARLLEHPFLRQQAELVDLVSLISSLISRST